MNEEVNATQGGQPDRKNYLKKVLLGLLVVVLVAAAAGAGYWWRSRTAKSVEDQQAADIVTLQNRKTSLEKQLADEKAKNVKATPSPTPACTAKSPTASVIDNIKASITSGNTAALEGYMAASVNVVIAASGAAGAKTPTQAVTSITNFIGDPSTSSWNFALPASTLSTYSGGSYGQYFPSIAVVGRSGDNKIISFSFDCNAKISTVFLASNENLVTK